MKKAIYMYAMYLVNQIWLHTMIGLLPGQFVSLLFTTCLVGSLHLGDTLDLLVRHSRLNPLIQV